MRAFRAVLALAVALTLSSTSQALSGFVSGRDLLDICSPQRADPVYRLKVAECRGYVIGIADSFDCFRQSSGFSWNGSKSTSQVALVNNVVEWLSAHPENLKLQADGLVAAALAEAHPC